MESKQLIQKISEDISELKGKGYESLSIEGFEQYLEELSKETTKSKDIQLAEYTAQHQANIEKYREDRAEWRELFKATTLHAQSTLKLLSILNGGAAVALLAFIGKIWTQDFSSTEIAVYLPVALLVYCVGVGFSGLAQVFSFASQHLFTYSSDKCAEAVRGFALSCAIAALLAFFSGSYVAYIGILGA